MYSSLPKCHCIEPSKQCLQVLICDLLIVVYNSMAFQGRVSARASNSVWHNLLLKDMLWLISCTTEIASYTALLGPNHPHCHKLHTKACL